VVDAESGTTVLVTRISTDTVFATAELRHASGTQAGAGLIGVNRRGQVRQTAPSSRRPCRSCR
jgi:hypothetical protein